MSIWTRSPIPATAIGLWRALGDAATTTEELDVLYRLAETAGILWTCKCGNGNNWHEEDCSVCGLHKGVTDDAAR